MMDTLLQSQQLTQLQPLESLLGIGGTPHLEMVIFVSSKQTYLLEVNTDVLYHLKKYYALCGYGLSVTLS